MKAQNGLLCLHTQMDTAAIMVFPLWYSNTHFSDSSPSHFVIYCLAFGSHSSVLQIVFFFLNGCCYYIQNNGHWIFDHQEIRFSLSTDTDLLSLTDRSRAWILSLGPWFLSDRSAGASALSIVFWTYSAYLFHTTDILSWLGPSDSFISQSRSIYWTLTPG